MWADTLTVNQARLPDAHVGEVVIVQVRALVTKIETEIIDIGGYRQDGENDAAPGETRVDLLVLGMTKDAG